MWPWTRRTTEILSETAARVEPESGDASQIRPGSLAELVVTGQDVGDSGVHAGGWWSAALWGRWSLSWMFYTATAAARWALLV